MACGKKGPPLPPLVKLPVAPSDVTAVRRADTVDLQLTVPSANTDSSRPANVARVDVYAFTGPATVSEADVLKQGTKVASIAVKAPRDPDATFDPDDPEQFEADIEPPEGEGLDQGAVAHVQEALTGARCRLRRRSRHGGRSNVRRRRHYDQGAPRSVVAARGRAAGAVAAATAEAGSHIHGDGGHREVASRRSRRRNRRPRKWHTASTKWRGHLETPLTKPPIAETQYTDARLTWGATRCYAVRSVETVDALSVESEATPPACVTLADTFPPAAPKGLQAVATEGVINLIWDANTETDLDGYILLRGVAPGDELAPITPSPIRETAFQDRVPAGVRYVYALKAVDKAGNASPPSERIEETAR